MRSCLMKYGFNGQKLPPEEPVSNFRTSPRRHLRITMETRGMCSFSYPLQSHSKISHNFTLTFQQPHKTRGHTVRGLLYVPFFKLPVPVTYQMNLQSLYVSLFVQNRCLMTTFRMTHISNMAVRLSVKKSFVLALLTPQRSC